MNADKIEQTHGTLAILNVILIIMTLDMILTLELLMVVVHGQKIPLFMVNVFMTGEIEKMNGKNSVVKSTKQEKFKIKNVVNTL